MTRSLLETGAAAPQPMLVMRMRPSPAWQLWTPPWTSWRCSPADINADITAYVTAPAPPVILLAISIIADLIPALLAAMHCHVRGR